MRTILFFILAGALLFHAGCGNSGRPDDLPKLYPVNISVTQEGNALEGATVTLVSKTPARYGVVAGTTNTSGTASFLTHGFSGVPAGEYTVRIDKRGTEGAREAMQDGEPVMVGGQIYQYVEPQYSRGGSPFSIFVTEKGASETFDVGKPVRVFVSNAD